MNSLRYIILILLSLTYLGSVMSDSIQECIGNIYVDFGYGKNKPHNSREVWPMRAFLKLDIRDMDSENAKGYFEHLHTNIMLKGDMLLPNQFCEVHAKGQDEISKCSDALASKYLLSVTKLDIIKDTFWRYKETDFIILNPDGSMNQLNKSFLAKISKDGEAKFSPPMFTYRDGSFNYLYMYFHHLSKHFQYSQVEKKLPYTPKEYCQIDKRIKHKEKQKKRSKTSHESEEGSTSGGKLLDFIED